VLQRDLVKEIVEAALRAEGLKVGFYHSVIDWHHDQYDYALSKGNCPILSRAVRTPTGRATMASISISCTGRWTSWCQLRPGGHPLVGLQLAGLPGRRRLARFRN
jgi:hypothetical protein